MASPAREKAGPFSREQPMKPADPAAAVLRKARRVRSKRSIEIGVL
jgi:hypothetical protein